jgi:aspartate/methionine/tyrosine aminotransferase
LWLFCFSGNLYDSAHRTRLQVKRMTVLEAKVAAAMPTNPTGTPEWRGRFPYNEIISLLDVNRPFNLAESTSQDLTVGEVLDLAGLDTLRGLKLGYGRSAGGIELREEIAKICKVSTEQIVTTQGTALGLFLLAFEACRPGDEAVLVTPCFPPSRDCLLGAGVAVREVSLTFEDGYQLDLDAFAASLSSQTKLVSLASPQNPSGVRTPRATIEQILALLESRAPRAILFIDETYREATYGSEEPESFAAMHPRIVTGSSVSKALGAPGLRTGWLTVPDPDLRSRLIVAKLNTVISGSVLDEALATALLRNRESVLTPRRKLLAEGLASLSTWCDAERDRIEWIRPDGGALCCLRLRADRFDDAAVSRFWELLPRHELQLASGAWFGESDRVFRLGFGYLPPGRLNLALTALSAALDATATCDNLFTHGTSQ